MESSNQAEAKWKAKETKKAEIKKGPAKQKKSKSKSSRNVVRTKDQIHIILDSGHGGIDPGAPKNPKITKKFLITTLITSIIFGVIYYLVNIDLLNLREFLK